MSIAKLFVDIGLNTRQFKQGLKDTETALEKHKRKLSAFASSLGTTMKFGALGAVTALGAIGIAVGKTGFEFNDLQERSLNAFTTMLGSAKEAQVFIKELHEFAKKTPFEVAGLTETSQKLLAFGFEAKQIFPLLTSIGDAVSGLGGSPELLNRITIALGQIKAKGKVQAEEMLQLTEAGIPAWELLAEKIGVSIPEAMKMVTKGMVDSDTAIAALTEGMNERFGGLMEKQAQTFNGMLSTIKDMFAQISGRVMTPFFELAKKGLQSILSFINTPEFQVGLEKFLVFIETSTPKVIKFIGSIFEYAKTFGEWLSTLNIFQPKNEIVGAIIDIGKNFVDLVKSLGELYPQWSEHLKLFLNVAATITTGIIKIVLEFVNGFIKNLTNMVQLLTAIKNGDWTRVWGELKQIVQVSLDTIKSVLSVFKIDWDFNWSKLVSPVTGFMEGLAKAFAPLSEMLGTMLLKPFKWALNQIIEWHNKLIRTVNSGLSFVPGAQLINIPEIPHFAKGGIAKRGVALVGEKGAELVAFNGGERIHPANETARMLSPSSKRMDIYIHNESRFPIDRQSIKEIAVALQKELLLYGNKVVFAS